MSRTRAVSFVVLLAFGGGCGKAKARVSNSKAKESAALPATVLQNIHLGEATGRASAIDNLAARLPNSSWFGMLKRYGVETLGYGGSSSDQSNNWQSSSPRDFEKFLRDSNLAEGTDHAYVFLLPQGIPAPGSRCVFVAHKNYNYAVIGLTEDCEKEALNVSSLEAYAPLSGDKPTDAATVMYSRVVAELLTYGPVGEQCRGNNFSTDDDIGTWGGPPKIPRWLVQRLWLHNQYIFFKDGCARWYSLFTANADSGEVESADEVALQEIPELAENPPEDPNPMAENPGDGNVAFGDEGDEPAAG